MSYSAPQLTENGITLPSYEERLEDLKNGCKQIFGDDVYLEPDSMLYQLISLVAKCWDDMNSVVLDTYNARNPYYASGVSLDSLMLLSGLRRKGATHSTVTLTMVGSPDITIPAGCQAIDDAGYVWEIEDEVTFDSNGLATAEATCTTAGAITAGVGTITGINTVVPDWFEVTNEAEAVPGDNVETDAEARLRRSLSLSLPAVAVQDGIRAALLALEGVKSVNLVVNDGSSTSASGIPAHSFCAVVDGGNSAEIAEAIFLKKSPGVGTYGNTTVSHIDAYGESNTIKYSVPTNAGISVELHLHVFADTDESVMSDVIPQAVAAYISSLGIGENLIVSQLYNVVYSANPNSTTTYSVTGVTASGNSQTDVEGILSIDYDKKPTCQGNAVVTHTTGSPDWTIEVS